MATFHRRPMLIRRWRRSTPGETRRWRWNWRNADPGGSPSSIGFGGPRATIFASSMGCRGPFSRSPMTMTSRPKRMCRAQNSRVRTTAAPGKPGPGTGRRAERTFAHERMNLERLGIAADLSHWPTGWAGATEGEVGLGG